MKKFFALYVFVLVAVVVGVTSARAGTIALWTFEEGVAGSPATSIPDVAGGNDGAAVNGPVYVDNVISNFGDSGLSFNGTNQTVFVGGTSGGALEMTTDFTIEVGVSSGASAASGFAVFMGDSQNQKDPYYIVIHDSGSVQFQLYAGGVTSYSVSSDAGAIQANSKSHIGAVFDFDDLNGTDNFMRLFIDHTEVASLNIGSQVPYYGDTDSEFWLGSVHNAFGFFSGTLTDVRISNVALTGDEMFQVPEPGILAIFGLGLLGLGLTRRRTAA